MKRLSLLIGIAVFAASCGRDINNKEAVKQGVVDYLAKRTEQTGLNMGLMNVDVTSVTFKNNEAHAVVSFKPKGSDGAGGMSMNYVLEKKGDKWVVKGRQDSAANPHGGGAVAPPQMPPGADMGVPEGAAPPAGGMPPNHPPVQGAKPDKK